MALVGRERGQSEAIEQVHGIKGATAVRSRETARPAGNAVAPPAWVRVRLPLLLPRGIAWYHIFQPFGDESCGAGADLDLIEQTVDLVFQCGDGIDAIYPVG